MKNNVLIVVAHTDDETISMGGTIKKHINNGDVVNAISMTDGVGARDNLKVKDKLERKTSSVMASDILGFSWFESFDFSDNRMDSYPLIEVVKCIESVKEKVQPNIVYTSSAADLNIDHRVVANAVLTAFRPQPNEKCKEIRLFEVLSATDYGHPSITGKFLPNLFISIENEWSSKIKAINAYESEMRDYPHARSKEGIKSLAELRGKQIGVPLAEAFEVIRKLED